MKNILIINILHYKHFYIAYQWRCFEIKKRYAISKHNLKKPNLVIGITYYHTSIFSPLNNVQT
jgi:hypothetical protein